MRRKHHPYYYRWKGKLLRSGIRIISHLRLLLRWMIRAVCMGVIVGIIGVGFVYAIQFVTAIRLAHPWVLLSLPLGGLLIVWLYRVTHDQNDGGTNMVLASLRAETELPVQMAPLIFLSTILTHLCGGSAGREGAALQLGGSIGSLWSRIFHLHTRDKRVMILCGMSAAFSAIFRTPVAAPIFAMEVVCVGAMHYAALVPCTVSSLTASWLAEKLGLPRASYDVLDVPELAVVPALKILLLGIFCAVVSILFCMLLHGTEKLFVQKLKNPYLRILAASGILWILLLLLRNQDYIGLGTAEIVQSIGGKTVWYAFLAKMLFTAVTLAGGFKGGEIVPSFFVGASFGCLFGEIAGLSPSFCAAVGMTALFCGVTNCPVASLLIATELFGFAGAPYYLLAIAVSYLLSGYYGLYKEQTFLSSKFSGGMVNHKTRE